MNKPINIIIKNSKVLFNNMKLKHKYPKKLNKVLKKSKEQNNISYYKDFVDYKDFKSSKPLDYEEYEEYDDGYDAILEKIRKNGGL